MLLIHPVPEERLAARVHRPVGMDSRWMTPTPGGGWPSRAQLLMGTLPAAADRDQTAPMAADTGLPAMRGTAAHTQGDAPSAPMVPAGPPATAPCLAALAAPGVAPRCTTRLLVAPPLVPVARDILPLLQRGPAPTAVGQRAAPPPPACHSTPAWEQN